MRQIVWTLGAALIFGVVGTMGIVVGAALLGALFNIELGLSPWLILAGFVLSAAAGAFLATVTWIIAEFFLVVMYYLILGPLFRFPPSILPDWARSR